MMVLAATFLGSSSASAQSASSGPRFLTVSRWTGLNPDGDSVTVSGSGYDTEKGVYVAFCLVPAVGQMPSPCGGGADLGGTTSASAWISSNPPSYGEGLAIPYGDGGTFTVTITVNAIIGNNDCRQVQCAIVTRSDHIRLSDRSQDVIIPVSFATPQPTATPTPPPDATATSTPIGATPAATATPTPSPTPSAAVSPPVSPSPAAQPSPSPSATPASTAPAATLSADGLSATAGSLRLEVSAAEDIVPGSKITVRGEGFDDAKGIYLALCVKPAAGAKLSTCSSGSVDASAWISSNPPAYAEDLATPYAEGGSFEVELTLDPAISASADCRETACVIATRGDDESGGDRSQELAIPVSFSDETPSRATPEGVTSSTGPDDGSDGGFPAGLVAGLIAGAGALAALAFVAVRKRRAGATAALLAMALLLGACGSSSASEAPNVSPEPSETGALPVTIRSADGREVTVTDTSRIVSLWGNVTEVLFDLGAGPNVVGRDVTSTEPEAAQDLPEVTRGHDVSAEGVLSLRPTLVLGSLDNTGPSDVLDHIRNVGVPVILFEDPESVEDIIPRIAEIARAVGLPEAGDALAQQTRTDLQAVEDALPDRDERLSVAFLYMRGQAGVYLIGGPRSGADSMIAAAGGIDAGTKMGLDNPFTPITSEALAVAAPDVILITTTGLESVGGLEGLLKIPGIAQTPAGENRRVITMDDQLLYSFGPRTPAAIETLSREIYGAATP